MPSIAVDAGPLIALFSKSDRHHDVAKAFVVETETSTLVTNMLVVGEVAAMVGSNHARLVDALGWIADNLEIDDHAGSELRASLSVIEKYKDLPADLADASLVALCERRGITSVASLDRDFDVYRLSKGRRLQNVFPRS